MFHEDIAVHLERGDRLDAHDCPCWRVAYTQGVQLVDVGSIREWSSCRNSWISSARSGRRKREYLHAARRLVSRDVAELQQTIAELQAKAAKVDRP